MCQLASAGVGNVCVNAENSVWRKAEMERGQDI